MLCSAWIPALGQGSAFIQNRSRGHNQPNGQVRQDLRENKRKTVQSISYTTIIASFELFQAGSNLCLLSNVTLRSWVRRRDDRSQAEHIISVHGVITCLV